MCKTLQNKHNITVAMILFGTLACSKDSTVLTPFLKWNMSTYTFWNICMHIFRHILHIPEWDSFLCVNSVGILLAFKTAFAQGLDENIRKKINQLNFRISRFQFILGDVIFHYLPALYSIYSMISTKRKIPIVSVTYAITISTWFAFRQSGKLDPSQVYVPHPWKRGWLAFIVGVITTSSVIKYAIEKNKCKLLLSISFLLLPLCSTAFDKELKTKYTFEFLTLKCTDTLPKRTESTPILNKSSLPPSNQSETCLKVEI